MSSTFTRRMARAALLAALAAPGTAVLPETAPFAVARAHAAPTIAELKATLASYGSFVAHEKYGEVWVPSVTPQGWHPYPPCNWIYEKDLGWFYDDKTPWGEIVHHYGRWTHEAERGWMWVAGEEWSPGWVVWRTSDKWIGWAPTPPDQDIKTISAESFNNDKFWTFMEAAKFGKSCSGEGVALASEVPVLLRETRYVTETKFVQGIAVFVFPPVFVGPIVDLDVFIHPWSPIFISNVFVNWIWVWNHIDIDVVVIACHIPEHEPLELRKVLETSPPPPPPGRRADDQPDRSPPGFRPPSRPKTPGEPPVTRIPERRRPLFDPPGRRPPVARIPDRPNPQFDPPRRPPVGRIPKPRIPPRDDFEPPSRIPTEIAKPNRPPKPRPTSLLPPRQVTQRPGVGPSRPRLPRPPTVTQRTPRGPKGAALPATPRLRPPAQVQSNRLLRPSLLGRAGLPGPAGRPQIR